MWIMGGVALVLFILLLNYNRIRNFLWPSDQRVAELMGEKNSILDKLGELIRGDYPKVSQKLNNWLVDTVEGDNLKKSEGVDKTGDKNVDFENIIVTLSFNSYILKLSVSVPYIIKNVTLVEAVLQKELGSISGDLPPRLGAIVHELRNLIALKNKLASTPLHRDISRDIKDFKEEIKTLV